MAHSSILMSLTMLTLLTCSEKKKSSAETAENTAATTTASTTSVESAVPIPVETTTPVNTTTEVKPQKIPDKSSTPPVKTEKPSTSSVKSTTSSSEGRIGLIYISEGEKKLIEDKKIYVKFNKILEDSRCPTGVTCVWEGMAVAEVELSSKGKTTQTVKLATINNAERGNSESTVYNGYKISLKAVQPYPKEGQNKENLKGNYKIGLLITNTDEKPVEGLDPRVIRTAPATTR